MNMFINGVIVSYSKNACWVVVGYPGEATVTIVDNDSEINVVIKYVHMNRLNETLHTYVLYFKDCC